MIDVKAALVEVKTRFLVREVSARGVVVAENILKKGLLAYPQVGVVCKITLSGRRVCVFSPPPSPKTKYSLCTCGCSM